jgi:hypothetical protein
MTLVGGFLIGIGVVFVAIGLAGWTSFGYSYITLRDAWLASDFLGMVSVGFFSLIIGLLLLIRRPVNFLNLKSPNASLVGALGGGGGALALISLQNLFYFLLSQDYFGLELFAAEVSIGLFLVFLAAAVNRRR